MASERSGWRAVSVGTGAPAKTSALSNTVALIVARVVAAFAATGVLIISAHRLDDGDFGVVTSTLAAGFVANALVTFGTDTVVTRGVARGDGSDARVALRFQLAAASSLMVAAALGVIAGWWPVAVLVQAVVLVPLAVVTVSGAVLRGQRRMRPLALAAGAGGAVSLVGVAIGYQLASGPLPALIALGAGAVVVAALQAGSVRRSGFPAAVTPSERPHLLRRAAPFATMVVLAAIGAQGGLLLVEAFAETPTGGYGAGLRILEAGRLVPASAMAAWFPVLAAPSPTRPAPAAPAAGYRTWRWGLLGFSTAATLSVVVLAPTIDRVVFDRQPDGVALMRILALSLPLTTVRLLWSTEAIAADRERLVTLSAVVGTGVLLIGGVLAAGRWGAPGVAGAHVGGVAAAAAVLAPIGRPSRATASPPSSPTSV